MGRAPCCDKANVKRGPWSPEEDAILKAYIEEHGTGGNWIALPHKIGLKRCGKSCRLRWLNYLRPNIKHGGFTEEEDNIISSLYISIGSRWSIIAAQLPGRTDNDIKNYWNTRLKKKLLGRRKKESIEDQNSNNSDHHTLSPSALERLQLHMQLQNPNFSFYDNPALWPKLHPFQQKIIQNSLQTLNPTSNVTTIEQKHEFYEPTSANNNNIGAIQPESVKISSLESSGPVIGTAANPVDSGRVEQFDMEPDQVSALQAELDDILNNNRPRLMGDYVAQQEQQTADQLIMYDCFGEMNGSSKDNLMMWWSGDFDAKSASSNSWDSTATATTINPAVFQQDEGILYQDYELGYIL